MILHASRIEPAFAPATTRNMPVRNAEGVRYERRLFRAIQDLSEIQWRSCAAACVADAWEIDYQPWFDYFEPGLSVERCAPDVLVYNHNHNFALVIDAKRTYNPTILDKLQRVYIPVVAKALRVTDVRGLVVCERLTPLSPRPLSTLTGPEPLGVYHWRGTEPLVWA